MCSTINNIYYIMIYIICLLIGIIVYLIINIYNRFSVGIQKEDKIDFFNYSLSGDPIITPRDDNKMFDTIKDAYNTTGNGVFISNFKVGQDNADHYKKKVFMDSSGTIVRSDITNVLFEPNEDEDGPMLVGPMGYFWDPANNINLLDCMYPYDAATNYCLKNQGHKCSCPIDKDTHGWDTTKGVTEDQIQYRHYNEFCSSYNTECIKNILTYQNKNKDKIFHSENIHYYNYYFNEGIFINNYKEGPIKDRIKYLSMNGAKKRPYGLCLNRCNPYKIPKKELDIVKDTFADDTPVLIYELHDFKIEFIDIKHLIGANGENTLEKYNADISCLTGGEIVGNIWSYTWRTVLIVGFVCLSCRSAKNMKCDEKDNRAEKRMDLEAHLFERDEQELQSMSRELPTDIQGAIQVGILTDDEDITLLNRSKRLLNSANNLTDGINMFSDKEINDIIIKIQNRLDKKSNNICNHNALIYTQSDNKKACSNYNQSLYEGYYYNISTKGNILFFRDSNITVNHITNYTDNTFISINTNPNKTYFVFNMNDDIDTILNINSIKDIIVILKKYILYKLSITTDGYKLVKIV